MDPRLAEAARSGNIDTLYVLLREDPYLLEDIEAVPFIDTPLHKAVISKQTRFAMEMMNLKSSFARKLNPDGVSPLHLAVKNSRYQMVFELLQVDPSLALVKGREGMTPQYLAVRNGASHLVLLLLVLLHIAVANGKMEVLEALIGWLSRYVHMTAESIKDEELKKLVSNKKINRNILNGNVLKVLDVLQRRGQQMDMEELNFVLESGAKKAGSLPNILEFYRLTPTSYKLNFMITSGC